MMRSVYSQCALGCIVLCLGLVGCTTFDPLSEAPPPTDDPPDDNGIDPDLDVCGGITASAQPVAPNLLFVVDKSGSMRKETTPGSGRTKIQDTQDALRALVDEGADLVRFGWMQYPAGDTGCGPGQVAVSCAEGTAPAIRTMVDALVPGGGTPTGESLQNADASPALHDPARSSYVVLLTDGMPTCPTGGSDVETPEDQALALAAVQTLYSHGIETFVIGLGTDLNSSNPTLLNQMAVAGGRPRANSIRYFQANSLAELTAVLSTIGDMVLGCSFVLDPAPEELVALAVSFDGAPVARDPQHAGGWDFDAAENQVTFYGNACTLLRTGAVGEVTITMLCAEPSEPGM